MSIPTARSWATMPWLNAPRHDVRALFNEDRLQVPSNAFSRYVVGDRVIYGTMLGRVTGVRWFDGHAYYDVLLDDGYPWYRFSEWVLRPGEEVR